jgi:hypothetical protein
MRSHPFLLVFLPVSGLSVGCQRMATLVRAIYRLGNVLGNNPNTFSKVGDCEAKPTWFLSDLDLGPLYSSLGE